MHRPTQAVVPAAAAAAQGLTLVHSSAQCKRFLWITPREVSEKWLRLS